MSILIGFLYVVEVVVCSIDEFDAPLQQDVNICGGTAEGEGPVRPGIESSV